MITKGIRGAITVEENSTEAIGSAVIKLLTEMINRNKIETNLISHAIFSLTPDLNAEFPAKYARINLKWKDVPMMCFNGFFRSICHVIGYMLIPICFTICISRFLMYIF